MLHQQLLEARRDSRDRFAFQLDALQGYD